MNIPFNITMFKKNIHFIQDLFSENGELLGQKDLKDRIGTKYHLRYILKSDERYLLNGKGI